MAISIILIILFIILFSQSRFVLAAVDETIPEFSKYESIEELVKAITDKIFYFAVIICPLLIVVGAFLFLTSAGDPGRTKLGKDIIKWSVIGLAVILFSKGLYSIIKHILTG